jgi:DNA-binding FrmR family transcriptional regulator
MAFMEGVVSTKDIWSTPPIIPPKVQQRLATDVGPLKGPKKALTPQQWRFVQEYVSNDGRVTLREAALRAGYSEGSAQAEARRLTNPKTCPHVVAAIQAYRAELAMKYNTTYERHMRDLQTIREEEVQRKLDELKQLYGGPPPKALIDAETGQVLASADKGADPPYDPTFEDVDLSVFDVDVPKNDA